MGWQGTPPSNSDVVTVAAQTALNIPSFTTDANTDDVIVIIANSHNRTISGITFGAGVNLAEELTAVYLASGRISIWRLNAAPGVKTETIAVTFSGTTNAAAVAGKLEGITRVVLDTMSVTNDASGQPSSGTLDPTEVGSFVVSAILRGGAIALSFASGTEHVDIAGATGQLGLGTLTADGVTEVVDWGTIAAGGFAHIAIALEEDSGASAVNVDPNLIPSASSAFEPDVAQVARGSAVVSGGGYRDHAASTLDADLLAALNEAARNDGTYIESPENPSDASFEMTLSQLLSADGYRMRYTYGKSSTGGQQINVVVQLRSPDGTVLLREWTHTNVPAFPVFAEQDISDLSVNGQHRIRLISDAV